MFEFISVMLQDPSYLFYTLCLVRVCNAAVLITGKFMEDETKDASGIFFPPCVLKEIDSSSKTTFLDPIATNTYTKDRS
jgi:hypothetical protein